MEQHYLNASTLEHRKSLGQFFTPPAIAATLCQWVADASPATLLDPAAGAGVLLRQARRLLPACRLTAIDVDPGVLQYCRRGLAGDAAVEWLETDFLTWREPRTFDAVVANPPYLRHHQLQYSAEVFREIGDRGGVRLSRLSNAYALFLLEICRRLNPGGRAGLILPGEWLNANFGRPLKQFLLEGGWLRRLVYFSHGELVFDDALTTACLLLLERPRARRPRRLVETWFVPAGGSVDGGGVVRRRLPAEALLACDKWSWPIEHGLADSRDGWVRLGELAESRRGIATGANRFFHISEPQAQALGIAPQRLTACLGKAAAVRGLVVRQADWEQLRRENRPCHLIRLDPHALSAAEARYIAEGERQGLPQRYLLAARTPWYAMERRPPAPLLAAVFGRSHLRFLWNQAGAENLTAFHCVYPREPGPLQDAVLTACLNSDAVRRRAREHQRVYGGGLYKFEPRDLLEIRLPDPRRLPADQQRLLRRLLGELDQAMKLQQETRVRMLQDKLDAVVEREL